MIKIFNLKILSFIFFIFIFSNCSSNKYISTGVDFISEANGVLKLRSTGEGTNVKNAAVDAEINALKLVLFRGVPGSSVVDPLLSTDESKIMNQHQKYFNSFFNEKRYITFIKSSDNAIKIQSNKSNNKRVLLVVEINLQSLKKDLESFGVVRKFDY